MRPVNLIPPEERRGESAPSRKGILAYAIVAVLAVALVAVCASVFLDKQVADREAEEAVLQAQVTEAQARADSLSSFVSFQELHDARVITIDQLARSRFDWERVLRELSLVIPEHVWLTSMSGSVAGAAEGSESELSGSITGPSLVLSGCGRSHRDVARFVAAMKDIDGVTRVVATDSAKTETVEATAPTGGGDPAPQTGDNCQTRSTVPQFNLIAAFDGVVTEAADPTVPVAPVADGTEPAPAEAGDDVAAQQGQNAGAAGDVAAAEGEAQSATNLVPGG